MVENKKKAPILEIAIDDSGQHVHINNVKNGEACNCICPYCGEQLTAKQGKGGKAPHFAHKPDSSCNWKEYAKQTNIHWRAEKIFLEEKTIKLPALIKQKGNIICTMFEESQFDIIAVKLETRISNFIPDIILQIESAIVLVEIYVTHPVDEEKKIKIEKEGKYFVIEIDLSDKVHDDITDEELRCLLKDMSRIKWIYNPNEQYFETNLEKISNEISFTREPGCANKCPQSRRNISDCNNCRFFLGDVEPLKVRCIYQYCCLDKTNCNIRLPKMKNVPKKYDNVLPPRTQQKLGINPYHRISSCRPKIEYYEEKQKNQNRKHRKKGYSNYKRFWK